MSLALTHWSLKVNTKDDEIAQMATEYTPLEITYFKAVVRDLLRC
jgi:hypothetical protein